MSKRARGSSIKKFQQSVHHSQLRTAIESYLSFVEKVGEESKTTVSVGLLRHTSLPRGMTQQGSHLQQEGFLFVGEHLIAGYRAVEASLLDACEACRVNSDCGVALDIIDSLRKQKAYTPGLCRTRGGEDGRGPSVFVWKFVVEGLRRAVNALPCEAAMNDVPPAARPMKDGEANAITRLTHRELCKRFDLNDDQAERLRKRLDRFRANGANSSHWTETERSKGESKYLFVLSAVQPLIKAITQKRPSRVRQK